MSHSRVSQAKSASASQSAVKSAASVQPMRKAAATGGKSFSNGPALSLSGPIQRKCAECSAEDETAVQASMLDGEQSDQFETEADQTADAVVNGDPMPQLSPVTAAPMAKLPMRLKSDDGEPNLQAMPVTLGSEIEPPANDETSEPTAQLDSNDAGSLATESELSVDPSGGTPMDAGTKSTIESTLNSDLSNVRVHQDAEANKSTAALNARAFTIGNHIWMGSGETQSDLGLMAHESAHVVQQGAAANSNEVTPATSETAGPAVARTPNSAGAAASSSASGSTSNHSQSPSAASPSGVGQSASGGPASAGPASGGAGPVSSASNTGPASAVGVSGGGAANDAVGGDLLMPEPPGGLTGADRARLNNAQNQTEAAEDATTAMPSSDETVVESRSAVEEPQEETAARAAGVLAEALGERAEPSPEIEQLCEDIKRIIRRQRPPDEEALAEFDPQQAAQSAGRELNSSVEGDAQRVEGEYSSLEEPPEGTPQQQAQPLETPATQVETPGINATQAVPDEAPAETMDLSADVEAQNQRISDSGMDSAPAREIEDPSNPVVQAREASGELGEAAQRAPEEVMAEQVAVREEARGEMQSLQQQALQALRSARSSGAQEVGGGMVNLGTTEEEMRTNAANEAQRIFDAAQTQVTNLLDPLPRTALQRWDTGIQVLSTRVEQQSTEFNNWKRERYEGVSGTALEVVEYFTGLPDWAIDWLNDIEISFGDDVCNLIREISSEVNTVIATCEEIIDNANRDIAAVFSRLPESLQTWAAGEQARFESQISGLQERAANTRESINSRMVANASQSVDQVRSQIHEMRLEAQGIIGQISAAIDQFAEDPARFIINGLLRLVGIAPGAFWALVDRIGEVIEDIADDPMNFANNMATALGEGFQGFFDNFGNHVLSGFFDWLFSGLGSVGVQIPSDFSLSSIITFILQLMGITWERIREILARHIGEENVALLEQAYELISTLMEQGVDGIYEMISEQLNPRTILDAILSAAVDFLIESLITAVTPRVIAMFNPAGAIAQAIEVIYRILAWVFNNAARIFSLVETIVNGAADLIAGNTSGMAAAVESALSRLIAPVIDFLAGFLGLGNLPDQIAQTIAGFQEMVLAAIDRVVAWLAERARALLRALGLGGEDDEEEDDRTEEEKVRDLESGLNEADRLLQDEDTPLGVLANQLIPIKERYKMRSLEFVVVGINESTGIEQVQVVGEVNPTGQKPPKPHNLKELVNSLSPINSKYRGYTVTIISGPLRGISVDYNSMGFPDFEPFSIATVNIRMRGNRSYRDPDGDFGNANEAAGFDRQQRHPDHTWHHHQNRRTMQLIPRDIHEAFRHSGGVWVLKHLGER